MKNKRAIPLTILALIIFFLWACGGGGSSGSTTSSTSSGSAGTLSLTMVDAPGGNYQAVYVTIKEVQVCMRTFVSCDEADDDDCGCRWKTVATLNQTFNLLELVNGVVAALGETDLEAGTYNQMRLLLYDEPDDSLNLFGDPHPWPQYLIDENDVAHKMKVPSGYQTGIKLVHPFEIENNLTTELILDFDVARSVVKAGNSGKYLLKPTIKVIGTFNRNVYGVVTNDDDDPLEGAMVTAWYEDGDGSWIAAMSTHTDTFGRYTLYLGLDVGQDSEEYQIVAMAEGYEPGCRLLTVEMDRSYPNTDFVLSPVEMVGTVSGTITGTAPVEEDESFPVDPPVVTVSFSRYVGDCIREPVEIDFVTVTDDDDVTTADIFYNSNDGTFQYAYSIDLPAGEYDVTATSEGLTPIPKEVTVVDGLVSNLPFDFDAEP